MNRLIPLLILAVGCGAADKKQVNEACAAASDCADNICLEGICASAAPEDNGQRGQGAGLHQLLGDRKHQVRAVGNAIAPRC